MRNLNVDVLQPCTAHVNDATKTRSEYLAALDKFLAIKKLKPMPPSSGSSSARDIRAQASAAAAHASHRSKKRERFAALSRAKRVYEMSRCELTHSLNRAHARSQLDVAETIISTVYTQLSFHHQCHEIFEQRKGGMRHLQQQIASAREDTERAEQERKKSF